MTNETRLQELLKSYQKAAEGTGAGVDPEQNNQNVDKLHECYKQLKMTKEGREAIMSLINDPNPFVRCWAAAHSLQWIPAIARSALEALRDSNGPGSFDAKWTLIEFDNGDLSFDY
jgi:uncharacterized protein DUF2019